MPPSKYATLVERAEQNRSGILSQAIAKATAEFSTEDVSRLISLFSTHAKELKRVNDHITVSEGDIEAAKEAYEEVGRHLVQKLGWPEESIRVLPQGSASTQTLIRYPSRQNFDIDAVCLVDIDLVQAMDPMGFFDRVGDALCERYQPTRKKRCWNINFSGERFYLEFTPSVPLDNVPASKLDAMALHFLPTEAYRSTALAVVDTPTKRWKTSNPEGFTQWVADTAKIQLVSLLEVAFAAERARADIVPVPNQDVEITDTLRVAIRLFKRHRDMCVRRNLIEREYKPISVIIVTLLTACYAGLAELGRRYHHPVELLADLAELLPGMIASIDGEYHVDNPTVEGENFAERWNEDGGTRARTFQTWSDILAADMRRILAARGEEEIRQAVHDVFGCGVDGGNPGGGNGDKPTKPRPIARVRKTSGLA